MSEQVDSRVLELKRQYGARRAELLTAAVDVAFEGVRRAEVTLSEGMRSNMSRKTQESVWMAAAQEAAQDYRNAIRERYREEVEGWVRILKEEEGIA